MASTHQSSSAGDSPTTALARLVESRASGALWVERMVEAVRDAGGVVTAQVARSIEPVEVLVAALALRPDLRPLEYGEWLGRSSDVARIQRAAATRLVAVPTRSRAAAGALAAALEGRPVAGCLAACCEASGVRYRQIEAKVALVRAIGRIDPAAIGRVDGATLAWLMAPPGRRLALPALDVLAQAPWAARTHRDLLLRVVEHPDGRVVEGAVRALRAAGLDRRVLSSLLRSTHDARGEVVVAALRALDRLAWGEAAVAAAFDRAVGRREPRVRSAALWMLERRGVLGEAAWAPRMVELAEREPHPSARAIAARAIARATSRGPVAVS